MRTLENVAGKFLRPFFQRDNNAVLHAMNSRIVRRAGGFLESAGKFFEKALDVLYPQNCVCCEGDRENGGPFLCGPCRESVVFITRPYCHRCGSPAEISYDYPREEFECGLCRKGGFGFDRARSLGPYDAVLKQLIHHFKYRNRPGAIKEIASLLDKYFSGDEDLYREFLVVSVPLHVRKLRERGFDQSYLIAEEAARRLRIPHRDGLLKRIKETEPQAKKKRGQRRENIRGAFQAGLPGGILGRDILLVDDVFTTGSTVDEAARVLKRAGARRVFVFTLARA